MTLQEIIQNLAILKEKRDEIIIELYTKKNLSLLSIATEANMQQSSISRILSRRGIQLYGRGRPRKMCK